MLSHRIRPVLPPLAPYVEHLWTVHGQLPGQWRNMILPDGATELIINLGDPQNLCAPDNAERFIVFRHSWFSGERTAPIVIDETGLVHLVGVRLRAGGAWPFLGVPLKEFADEVVELEAILGNEMRQLRERLGSAPTDDDRFDIMEGWLWRRFRQHTRPTRAVSHALAMIRARSSEARITRLADEIGISHKHLLREFDRCVGLRPKAFARVCAFQRVIQWVGWKREIDWADAAVRCGYYDQAHLIREFRAFSSFTPGSYLARRGPFLNYLEV